MSKGSEDMGKMDMFDEARAIKSTMQLCHLTQSELARQLGVSQSYVANKLRLLNFPEKIAEKIKEAGLSERHARSILRLIDTESRERGDQSEKNISADGGSLDIGSADGGSLEDGGGIAAALRIIEAVADRSLTVRECEALVDAELTRRLPARLSRAAGIDRIAELRSAISGGCEFLRSQGIDARTRASYLGTDLYITVVVKNA